MFSDVAVGIAIRDRIVYGIADWGGVDVIDVSDLSSPVIVGNIDNAPVNEGVVDGDFLYLCNSLEGLVIFDISDPAHPVETSTTAIWGANDVTVHDGIAYVGCNQFRIVTVNVQNPASPEILEVFPTEGEIYEVSVFEDLLFASTGQGGLLIFDTDSVNTETDSITVKHVSSYPNDRLDFLARGNPNNSQFIEELIERKRNEDLSDLLPIALTQQGSALLVNSNADVGIGSFRNALEMLQPNDTITFDPQVFPPGDPTRILLESALPKLDKGNILIDASQSGVILDGSMLTDGNGLVLTSERNVIRGLQIINFPLNGILLSEDAYENVIGGDRSIGSGPTGQGNVIGGNGEHGILLKDGGVLRNLIIGNRIGTDHSGMVAMPNQKTGITITYEASENQIGSAKAEEGNLISGNRGMGIYLCTDRNRVMGNIVGLDVTGYYNLGNGLMAIDIDGSENLIGGFLPAERNIVSGNGALANTTLSAAGEPAVRIGIKANGNLAVGNYLGLNINGTDSVSNDGPGIVVEQGGYNNTFYKNLISGNAGGIKMSDWATSYNIVCGNSIGTDKTGTVSLPNVQDERTVRYGVAVMMWAEYNVVGGKTAQERNLINGDLNIEGWNAIVMGNNVGVDIEGENSFGDAEGVGTHSRFVHFGGCNSWSAKSHQRQRQ